ncbi:MAG: hypothetical protein QM690_09925 [Sphingobium sp.]
MTTRRGLLGALSAVAALAGFPGKRQGAAVAAGIAHVRPAGENDLPRMVDLIEARRRDYQRYEPRFWRKADDSAAKTLPFFRTLLSDPRATALVAEGGEGRPLSAFLIAVETPAPPVYAPGGPTILVDDFAVADPALWPTAGRALLDALRQLGQGKGWGQIVVVSARRDAAKQALLRDWNLSLASTWWTGPF